VTEDRFSTGMSSKERGSMSRSGPVQLACKKAWRHATAVSKRTNSSPYSPPADGTEKLNQLFMGKEKSFRASDRRASTSTTRGESRYVLKSPSTTSFPS
jgi:hypothetical protein